MDLDHLLHHYFGSDDPHAGGPDAFADGRDRLLLDFAIERDPGRRFALWVMMDALDCAPRPEDAFAKEPDLRRNAVAYLSAMRMRTD